MPTDFQPKYDYDPNVTKINVAGEAHTVPSSAPYVIYLHYLPRQEDPSTVLIPGLTEVTGVPNAGEFRVTYGEFGYGKIEFNVAQAGTDVSINYHGCGSAIWAENYPDGREGITKIQEAINDVERFAAEGFNDFVIGCEPHGGVKRIESRTFPESAIDGAFYRETLDVASERESFVLYKSSSVSFTFVGTGLSLISASTNSEKSISLVVDGDAPLELVFPTSSMTANQFSIDLVSGLIYGLHTVSITVTSESPVRIDAFDIIQTENTVKVDSGTAYTSGMRKEVSSSDVSFTAPAPGEKGRCDLVVVNQDGTISVVEGTDGENEKAFRVEDDGSISKRYLFRNDPFEKYVRVWKSGSSWIVNSDVSYSGGTRTYTQTTDDSFYIGFVGTGLDLLTNTGTSEGIIGVSVDGGLESTYDTYDSDTVFEYRISLASNLPFGYHEVKLRNTGTKNAESINDSLVIDAFDIYLPVTPGTPVDTQPIASALVAPQAGSVTVPERPNSDQEAGWIRHEEDSEVIFIGSWAIDVTADHSGGSLMYSVTADNYAEYTFIGSGIRVLLEQGSQHGIAAISVDGGAETNVDTYTTDVDASQEHVVYEDTSLTFGIHTVKVRVTGTKNSGSSNDKVVVDAFEIYRPLYIQDIRTLSPVIEPSPSDIQDTIVEKGSNINGNYIRWSNGVQWCWFSNLYSGSSPKSISLPAAFANSTYSIAINENASTSGMVVIDTSGKSNIGFTIHQLKNDASEYDGGARPVDMFAVGYWK